MPAADHGSGFYHLGPDSKTCITLAIDICFHEYDYHDSLQARLIGVIGH